MTTVTYADAEAMSPLNQLLLIRTHPEAATRVEQREAAELAAVDHIATHYPTTLARVLEPAAWRGQPAATADQLPTATAEFGRGGWLHYSEHYDPDGALHHDLALITPCACGRYQQHRLTGEDHLQQLLDALAADADLPCQPGACTGSLAPAA